MTGRLSAPYLFCTFLCKFAQHAAMPVGLSFIPLNRHVENLKFGTLVRTKGGRDTILYCNFVVRFTDFISPNDFISPHILFSPLALRLRGARRAVGSHTRLAAHALRVHVVCTMHPPLTLIALLLALTCLVTGVGAFGDQKVAAVAESAAAHVLNEHRPCQQACFGYHSKIVNGHCPTNFCGAGACCQRGVDSGPPCDGRQMGCDGVKCCVAAVAAGVAPPSSSKSAKHTPSPPRPPPSPPLSECAIARVTYEIGRMRHDEFGDKVYEVLVHVEPWRPESVVKLTYHQHDIAGGAERPIETCAHGAAGLAVEVPCCQCDSESVAL